MALITCPECRKEISDKATTCINCGYPLSNEPSGPQPSNSKQRNKITPMVIAGVALLVVVFICVISSRDKECHHNWNDASCNAPKTCTICGATEGDLLEHCMELSDNVYVCSLCGFVGDSIQDDTAPAFPVRLSGKEAGRIFDTEFEKIEVVIDDWGDLFDYWNDNDFLTIEDARTYEGMWKELSERVTGISNTLAEVSPPEHWDEHWLAYIDCLNKVSESYLKCSNWDTNQDGNYEASEMVALLRAEKDVQVALLREAMSLVDALKEDSATTATVPNNDSSKGDVCTECGKAANRYYTNPFSGKAEPYCQTHYQEIIDKMGDMEEDVGNSNQSKHTCERCSREGTHVYYSFTGQTEYYCTQHYEELMGMLEKLGIE